MVFLALYVEGIKLRARLIVESGQEHVPVLTMLYRDRSAKIIGIVADSPAEAIEPLLRANKPDAYVFVGEAWVTTTRSQERLAALQGGTYRVRDLPLDDRVEKLIIVGAERGGDICCFEAAITEVKGVRSLGEFEELENARGGPVVREW